MDEAVDEALQGGERSEPLIMGRFLLITSISPIELRVFLHRAQDINLNPETPTGF